jgi:hypothetical protein
MEEDTKAMRHLMEAMRADNKGRWRPRTRRAWEDQGGGQEAQGHDKQSRRTEVVRGGPTRGLSPQESERGTREVQEELRTQSSREDWGG